MAERPDLRQIAENIEEALSGFDRDALLEMLTYVFKEYVLDGAPPVLVSQVDDIAGLEGLSFPQLVETLQQRLEHPELALLQVSGDQVLVRVGGVLTPLDPGDASRPPPMPAAAPTAPTAPAALPADSADSGDRAAASEAERRGRGDLAGGRRGVVQAPPPRGVSVSSRPSSTPAPSAAPATPSAPASDAPPKADEPAKEPEGPGDDDASVRFSLLELD